MTRSDLALAALATAAVPGMKPVSVTGVRPAPDQPTPRYQVAFVEDATGRTWVVRAPLDAAGGAELERNDELVRLLGRHLPFKVPAAAGYADLGAAGRAAVYPYVEGSALNFRQLPGGPGLTSAVGRALAAVHNIQRELFEQAGTPVFDAAGYRARRLAELDRAAETGHVPTGLLTRWEQALDAAPLWEFSTTATHGSLDGGAFLVAFAEDDAASGRVVALTGWENAQVADPADDFAALVKQASPNVVDAVFESYAIARSQRPDGYLIHRARLASELQLITGLARAVDADETERVRERAEKLRKLDRLTSVDDSLVPRTALITTPPATPRDESPGESVPAASVETSPAVKVVEPAGAAEDSVGTEPEGVADPDATAPVPAPGQGDGRPASRDLTDREDSLDGGIVEVSDRSGAWQTVQGTDEADALPSTPDADGLAEKSEPDAGEVTEDPTEEIPAPVETASDETASDETASDETASDETRGEKAEDLGAGDADEAGGEADEEERLHTIYGMPSDADDSEDGAGNGPSDPDLDAAPEHEPAEDEASEDAPAEGASLEDPPTEVEPVAFEETADEPGQEPPAERS